MFLLGFFCQWCVPFYHQKIRGIGCRRTCWLRRVPCFWGQGNCVHVELQWGECPEEVNLYGRNRWYVHLACGCLAFFLRLFCSHVDCLVFKKCPNVPESAAARLSTCLCVIVFVVPMMFIFLSSNLSHTRHHLSQPLLYSFLPIVLSLVAAVMCLVFCVSQVLLLCPFATL